MQEPIHQYDRSGGKGFYIKMARGYALNAKAEAKLHAAGVKNVYREDRGSEQWGRWRMRSGETLTIVGGLRIFGISRSAMIAALDHIHADGAAILDLDSGLRSDKDGAKMLDLALTGLRAAAVMPPGKAKAMAEASAKARAAKRMMKREAKAIWLDPRNRHLKNKEVVLLMPGWTVETAYNKFGKRGIPTGRRPPTK